MSIRTTMNALRGNDTDRFRICVAAGLVHPSRVVSGRTLLEHALRARAYDVMRILVDVGADALGPFAQAGFRYTIYGRIIDAGDTQAFDIVLPTLLGDGGGDRKLLRRKTLTYALRGGHLHFVEVLRERGVPLGEVATEPDLLSQILPSLRYHKVRAAWTIESWRTLMEAYFGNAKNQTQLLKNLRELISRRLPPEFLHETLRHVRETRTLKTLNPSLTSAAVKAKDANVLEYLSANGFMTDTNVPGGTTLLHYAVDHRAIKCIPIILREYPHLLEARSQDATPYEAAVKQRATAAANALRKHNANENTKLVNDLTALQIAAKVDAGEIIHQILRSVPKDAIPHADKLTLLHSALRMRDEKLIKRVADVVPNENTQNIMQILLGKVRAEYDKRNTPEHLGRVLKALVQSGFDLNKTNKRNHTPLTSAYSQGHIPATIQLLRLGANPEHPLPDGRKITEFENDTKINEKLRAALREHFASR